jgi:hypothetical protein
MLKLGLLVLEVLFAKNASYCSCIFGRLRMFKFYVKGLIKCRPYIWWHIFYEISCCVWNISVCEYVVVLNVLEFC